LWGPTYARIYQTSCNNSCYETYGANNNNIYNNNLNYNYHSDNYNLNNYNHNNNNYNNYNNNYNNTTLY